MPSHKIWRRNKSHHGNIHPGLGCTAQDLPLQHITHPSLQRPSETPTFPRSPACKRQKSNQQVRRPLRSAGRLECACTTNMTLSSPAGDPVQDSTNVEEQLHLWVVNSRPHSLTNRKCLQFNHFLFFSGWGLLVHRFKGFILKHRRR